MNEVVMKTCRGPDGVAVYGIADVCKSDLSCSYVKQVKEENQVKMVSKGKISIEENEIERERKAEGNDSDHIVMVTLSGSHCHGHPIYGNTIIGIYDITKGSHRNDNQHYGMNKIL